MDWKSCGSTCCRIISICRRKTSRRCAAAMERPPTSRGGWEAPWSGSPPDACAARRKFLEDCAAPLPAAEVPELDGSAEIGRCLRQLTEEAALFHHWLEAELPQGENTVGRRLLELAENSLVCGLFLLYLQQRHGELFPEFPATEYGDAARRDEANNVVARHPVAGHVARRCQDATATLLRLVRTAGAPPGSGSPEVQQSAVAAGKLAHRFLSAEAISAETAGGTANYMLLAAYEPGAFPAMRCRYLYRGAETEAAYEEVGLCRFSRRGGVAFSADVAIPVTALFGPESPLTRIAEFLGTEADRQLAAWRHLAKNPGVRRCLPYLENHGARRRGCGFAAETPVTT